ncbi:GNAT family N-acetyltransferase [Streptomyces sp. SBT349]|uniref:GNAT family N-acetyltransferase n=1 Tax=Streptomyces sp. SBT349 TaxID=1580539 RepID=UPI000A6B8C7C|nr:GNAT family N-acetyltransferase [Streptomyces sp. SBT349]
MVTIGRATVEDAAVVSGIIGEIAAYYGGEDIPGDMDRIEAVLRSDVPGITILLARDDGGVLGLASYSFLWPAAGSDHSLYLKELFVRETARRKGVGAALMAALSKAAANAGCSRVEWTADRDNPSALAFYEALGARQTTGKVFYRVQAA